MVTLSLRVILLKLIFNRYFYSVFTEEDCSDLSSLRKSNKLSSIIQSINFTTQDVFQELSQLNPNKACGPDLLTPLLLKKSAEFICEAFYPEYVYGFTP